MRLFAIGDLHMPGGDDKPMDVFGSKWDRHFCVSVKHGGRKSGRRILS